MTEALELVYEQFYRLQKQRMGITFSHHQSCSPAMMRAWANAMNSQRFSANANPTEEKLSFLAALYFVIKEKGETAGVLFKLAHAP
jgi:hypothetical protein